MSYYEEKILEGIFHYRTGPGDFFKEMEPQRMTNEILDLRAACERYKKQVSEAVHILKAD